MRGLRPVVYTGGTFDLFHRGHVAFLRQCARLGDVVVVVNDDDFVERFKGRRPIVPLNDRIMVLRGCKHVEDVRVNEFDEDSKKMIEAVSPDIVAIGSDWARKDYYLQMGFTQDWLDEAGIILAYVPYTWGVSSSEIRESIGDGGADRAR